MTPLAKNLEAVTTNEDMEIKTGPDDLAWSPGGESVAIIARGTPSTEPEVRADARRQAPERLLQPLRDTGRRRGDRAVRDVALWLSGAALAFLRHGGSLPAAGEPRHRPFREEPDAGPAARRSPVPRGATLNTEQLASLRAYRIRVSTLS